MSNQFGYSPPPGTNRLEPWWTKEKGNVHNALFGEVRYLYDQQRVRRNANIHFLRLYSNRAAASFSPQSLADGIDVNGERIKLNVVKSAIDAAVAQLGTNRPRPLYQTVRGDYGLIKKAERRGKFVTGYFHVLKQYMLGLDVFRDAAVLGSGLEHVYADHRTGRICAERVLPVELIVDEEDARNGKPQVLRRVRTVSRSWLAGQYQDDSPDIAAKIRDAKCLDLEFASLQTIVDPVTWIEAWKLPSYPGAGDGRRVMAVSNVDLLDEEYKRDSFPIAKFDWNTLPMGWWGTGAAEEISPIQVEINYIAQKIQKLMTLATSMIWKEKGSFLGEIDNRDWAVREYTGKPPMFQTTSSISAEYFSHMDRLYARAYEVVGISQLSATSKKPAGLDSGEALRAYNDIGSRRFQHTGQRWEQFHLDVGELICEAAKELEEAGTPVKVLAMGDKDAEELSFKDVDLARDRYILRPSPVNIMPDTPAGKIETATRLSQMAPDLGPYLMGLITGIPDLERAVAIANAPLDYAECVVGEILEKGNYTPPDGTMNLALTRDYAQRALLRAQIDRAPEKNLDLLRRFIADIDSLQARAEQAAMAQASMAQPGAGPAPQQGSVIGAGMPPPGPPGIGAPQIGAAA